MNIYVGRNNINYCFYFLLIISIKLSVPINDLLFIITSITKLYQIYNKTKSLTKYRKELQFFLTSTMWNVRNGVLAGTTPNER